MPKVVFYKKSNGRKPVREWLAGLLAKARDKVVAKIILLGEGGHKLGRPTVGKLDRGIYELRISHLGVNYRVLYFFDRKEIIVLAHAFVKKTQKVRKADIDKAVKIKEEFLS